MIMTKTPFRVTLGGGGTDLPSYYEAHGGFIFAMGIDKYVYLTINRPAYGSSIHLHGSEIEVVEHVSQLRHGRAREALRLCGIEHGLEVSAVADLPAGSGLGSSGAYLVGLLNALHNYQGTSVPPQLLAEEACHIEIQLLNEGIGKQDQYMAAFGGLTVLTIKTDGRVLVRKLDLDGGYLRDLTAHIHIYFTGVLRSAHELLKEQNQAMHNRNSVRHGQVADSLHRIRDLGLQILDSIENRNPDRFGLLLHDHWEYKKRLSSQLSLDFVDAIYSEVRAGFHVLGGKLIGAGGGGYLMLYCERDPARLERFMAARGMLRLHYSIEPNGTQVVPCS